MLIPLTQALVLLIAYKMDTIEDLLMGIGLVIMLMTVEILDKKI